jgi:hypothetical protein
MSILFVILKLIFTFNGWSASLSRWLGSEDLFVIVHSFTIRFHIVDLLLRLFIGKYLRPGRNEIRHTFLDGVKD